MFSYIKEGIVDYLYGVFLKDKNRFVTGKVIEDLPRFNHFRRSSIGRKCRKLAQHGIITPHYEYTGMGKTKRVYYRWKKGPKNIVFKKEGMNKMSRAKITVKS